MTIHPMNRSQQALRALLTATARGGTVRVHDGHDTWYCPEAAWDVAIAKLERLPAYEDKAAIEAYGDLCWLTRGLVCSSLNRIVHGARSNGPTADRIAMLRPWADNGDEVAQAMIGALGSSYVARVGGRVHVIDPNYSRDTWTFCKRLIGDIVEADELPSNADGKKSVRDLRRPWRRVDESEWSERKCAACARLRSQHAGEPRISA